VFAEQPASREFKLVSFGFTECPDVCPTTLVRVHQVLDALGNADVPVTPLFVTLDPARDTPQVLGRYATTFDPRIVGLTGAAGEIRAFASTYGVYPPNEAPPGMGEAINHSAKLYLLGRSNELLAAYQPTQSPVSIAADVRHAIEIARRN
jgi:protein SCO1/2